VLRALGAAFAYFSILPVGSFARGPAPDADALVALPLVGALIGALAGWAALLLTRVAPRAPHALPAALALCVLVVASGAIHLDGFLDGCDGFFASVDPGTRRAILKDPHRGSFALAGLLCAGTMWFAALLSLPIGAYPASLAFGGALARAAAVADAFAFPDPRRGRPAIVPSVIVLFALIGAAFWIAPAATLLVPAALAASFGLARWIAGRLDGALPGDAYGFIIVVLDVASVAALAVLAGAGRLGVRA
jgi:adenosylcobinamide-GDP ribazoletransferase